jgi:hypothetical protein
MCLAAAFSLIFNVPMADMARLESGGDMAQDHIRYDILTQEALRGVVRKVLAEVARTGLPGEHHFFISFLTHAPGVRISQRLLDQYPADMTIVLQNQFWDLKVGEGGFEVGLSFDEKPEVLYIPFTSIKGFFDPSVQFGMQLTGATLEASGDELAESRDEAATAAPAAPGASEAPGEKVVSLDAFRKK